MTPVIHSVTLPNMEGVHGRVDVAVVRRPTYSTHPLPYLQACVASGTREAPACRAGLGGETGGHFEELPTAGSALVGEHAAKLSVSSTGNALPKGFRNGRVAICGPHDGLVCSHQTAREFMIAIFALIGETFIQARHQPFPATTLRLRKAVLSVAQFMRMRYFLASGEREQVMKPRINPDRSIAGMWNRLWLRVDAEAQIPARSPFDDASTFDAPYGDVLCMEPHMPYAWDVDTCGLWRFERIRKGDTGELVALAFEPGLLGQLRETPLPGSIGGIQHTLQCMTRDAELFAVVCQQIVEGFSGVRDAVIGIVLDLTYGPVPHARQVKQPRDELGFLRAIEPKFQLPLDHLTPIFGLRCIAG